MSDVIVLKIPVAALRDLLRAAEVAPDPKPGHPDRQPHRESHNEPARAWTEKQRRLLFRLVYRLGHEGAAARRFITDQLGLRSDEEPSVQQASSLIDRLKNPEDHRGAA